MSKVRATDGTGRESLSDETVAAIKALVASWADRPLSPEVAAEIRPILTSRPLADTA